jgi:chorismate-pyruvate lyase
MATETLADVQQWMSSVLLEQGSLEEKLTVAEDRCGIALANVIADSYGASSARRLSVHTNGYVLRLVYCLRADFPALCAFVGESVFDCFAKAFIITHPSRSRSLFDLGQGLASFLEQTRPDTTEMSPERAVQIDVPIALARLERAISEASRAPGQEAELDGQTDISVQDVLAGQLSVAAAPCLRLLALELPVVELYEALMRDTEWKLPVRKSCCVAVSRRNFLVTRSTLNPWQQRFLLACRTEAPLGSILKAASQLNEKENSRSLAQVAVWLPSATELGLVTVKRLVQKYELH